MSFETVTPTDRELQKSLYVSAELLGMLKRCRCDLRPSHALQKWISAVTQRIEYLIQECGYGAVVAGGEGPALYKLSSRGFCADCRQGFMNNRAVSDAAEAPIMLTPIWQPALEFAVACTNSAASDFFEYGGRCMVEAFPSCLAKLRSALRRLQQILPRPERQQSMLEVEKLSGDCACCGKPIEVKVEKS